MKILQLMGSGTIGTEEMGPVSNDVCELSNNFAALGHRVTLIDAHTDLERRFLASAVELVEVDSAPGALFSKGTTTYRQRLASWRNFHQYVRAALTERDGWLYDVIHVHLPMVSFFLKRLYGHDYVYTAHTPSWYLTYPQERNSLAPTALKHRFTDVGRMTEIDTIRRSRLTIALGDYLKRQLPNAPILTIQNGTNLERWPLMDRPAARSELGIEPDEFAALFIGRISEVKGVDILVRAIAEQMSEMPRLRATAVGSFSGTFNNRKEITPFAKAVFELSEGLPIDFVGFVNNKTEEFRRYLAAADVVVVPSRADHQPNVILEALAMGTPVIGSDTGGIPNLISPDVGWLVPREDASALGNLLRTLYHQRELLETKRPNCRLHIERNFTWRKSAERHLEAFGRLQSSSDGFWLPRSDSTFRASL